MDILLWILKILVGIFGITFIIYWFNLDMKFVYRIGPFMRKHYDNMERDHRI